jgi:hypothetical protein
MADRTVRCYKRLGRRNGNGHDPVPIALFQTSVQSCMDPDDVNHILPAERSPFDPTNLRSPGIKTHEPEAKKNKLVTYNVGCSACGQTFVQSQCSV